MKHTYLPSKVIQPRQRSLEQNAFINVTLVRIIPLCRYRGTGGNVLQYYNNLYYTVVSAKTNMPNYWFQQCAILIIDKAIHQQIQFIRYLQKTIFR